VNIPTLLSLLRLVLTVPAAWAVLGGHWGAAMWVAVAAGLTDAADGWIARRWNLITRAGAWLDPVADKTLLVTLYLCLAATGAIPWWLVWLVLGRDALILLMAGYALAFTAFRDFPPSVWGKVSTVIQVTAAGVAIGARLWPSPPMEAVLNVLVMAAAAGTLVSGVHYFSRGIQRLRGDGRRPD
jgi:cardiolipin synthase